MVPMSFTGRGIGGSNTRLGLKEPHFPESSNPLGEEIHSMPSSLIEDDDGVGTRADLGGDLIEMKLHGFAVAEAQHQSGAGSELRAARGRDPFLAQR
jgi:hypothetical protein